MQVHSQSHPTQTYRCLHQTSQCHILPLPNVFRGVHFYNFIVGADQLNTLKIIEIEIASFSTPPFPFQLPAFTFQGIAGFLDIAHWGRRHCPSLYSLRSAVGAYYCWGIWEFRCFLLRWKIKVFRFEIWEDKSGCIIILTVRSWIKLHGSKNTNWKKISETFYDISRMYLECFYQRWVNHFLLNTLCELERQMFSANNLFGHDVPTKPKIKPSNDITVAVAMDLKNEGLNLLASSICMLQWCLTDCRRA